MFVKKLKLSAGQVIPKHEGDHPKEFAASDLNMMLAFQVNCPGCFIHSLPFMNRLHERYAKQGVNVFALSTAFEEFDLNTVEATRKLVQKGEVFGATRRALGCDVYDEELVFDVVTDIGIPASATKAHPAGGETFKRNMFRGTPTFVVFDGDFNIKMEWFGHQDPRLVEAKMDKLVKA